MGRKRLVHAGDATGPRLCGRMRSLVRGTCVARFSLRAPYLLA